MNRREEFYCVFNCVCVIKRPQKRRSQIWDVELLNGWNPE
jgi:hypothetical protein